MLFSENLSLLLFYRQRVCFLVMIILKKTSIYGIDPGGVLPYMGYMGMCRCEGYGFQAVYSRIGYINQSVWV